MGPRTRAAAVTLLLPALLAGCGGDSADALQNDGGNETADVVLDASIRYQTMQGWEASAQLGQDDPRYLQWRDSIVALAVNDLGIDRLRLTVRSGAENTHDWYTDYRNGLLTEAQWRCVRYAPVNDNANPAVRNDAGFIWTEIDDNVRAAVLPMKAALAQRGERLYLNVNFVAFDRQRCQQSPLVHDTPAEYAEFVLATLDHLKRTFNLVPDAWEVILEPDNTSFWRGTQIGNAIVATRALLQQHGYGAITFIAPSTTNMTTAVSYFDAMAQVPGALAPLSELSYHRYSGVSDASLVALAQRASANGLTTAMLEHIGSGYADLHADLKVGQNGSWQQFTLAYPGANDDGGKYYGIDLSSPGTPRIFEGQRTAALRQYFRFVRRGAVRIDAVSENASVDPLAFVNTDGRTVVVMKTTARATPVIGGLPAGRYGLYYTTGTAQEVELPEVRIAAGQTLRAPIPAAGVITVYAKG